MTRTKQKKSMAEKRAERSERREAAKRALEADLEQWKAKNEYKQANGDMQVEVKLKTRNGTAPQISQKEFKLLKRHPDSAVQVESATLKMAIGMYRQERKAAIARIFATDPELKALNQKFIRLDAIAQRLKPIVNKMKKQAGVGNAPKESETDDDSALSIMTEEDPNDDMARSDDETRSEDGIAQLKPETRRMDGLEHSTPLDAIPTQAPEVLTRGIRGKHSNGKRKRTRLTKSERQEFEAKRQRLQSSMDTYVGTGTTRTDQINITIEGDQHERQPVVKVEMQEPNIMVIRTKQEEPIVPVKMEQDEDFSIKQEERDEPQASMGIQHECGYCVRPCQCYLPL
jgi:hypothetical protein